MLVRQFHRCFNLENTLSKCSAKKKAASVRAAPEAKTCGMKNCENEPNDMLLEVCDWATYPYFR